MFTVERRVHFTILESTTTNNMITGNSGNNVLAGLGGADTLDGGAGTDTATYAASAAGVNVSLMTGLGSGGDAIGDTLFNFENRPAKQAKLLVVPRPKLVSARGFFLMRYSVRFAKCSY
jgi:RTX calcium-binding nonapeptide repeat (4 copies)